MITIITVEHRESLLRKAQPLTPENIGAEIEMIREAVEWVADDANKAVGLAAPQAGSCTSWFVMRNPSRSASEWFNSDNPGGPIFVVANPSIICFGGAMVRRVEGCLSIPGEKFVVKRASKIDVKFTPVNLESGTLGAEISATFTGDSARIFQHEAHHLNGVILDMVAQ